MENEPSVLGDSFVQVNDNEKSIDEEQKNEIFSCGSEFHSDESYIKNLHMDEHDPSEDSDLCHIEKKCSDTILQSKSNNDSFAKETRSLSPKIRQLNASHSWNDENVPPTSLSIDSGIDTDTSTTTTGSGWIGVGLRSGSMTPTQYTDSGGLTNYGLPLSIIRTDSQIEAAIFQLLRRESNISHRMIFHHIMRANMNAQQALLGTTHASKNDCPPPSDDSKFDDEKSPSPTASPVIVKKLEIIHDIAKLPRLTFNHVKSVAIRARRRHRQRLCNVGQSMD